MINTKNIAFLGVSLILAIPPMTSTTAIIFGVKCVPYVSTGFCTVPGTSTSVLGYLYYSPQDWSTYCTVEYMVLYCT